MTEYQNLIQCLENAAKTNHGITFIHRSDHEEFLSYRDLWNHAHMILKALQEHGLREHDELVLQLSTASSMVCMLWACMLGKIIAIPLALTNNQYTAEKFIDIWNSLQNPYLVHDSEQVFDWLANPVFANSSTADMVGKMTYKKILYQSLLENKDSILEQTTSAKYNYDDNIAYIQYSSGSTGTPKGVELRHRNILTNIYDMIEQYHLSANDTFLTWKPITHTFCLVGFHLLPIVLGVNQYLIPADVFTRSPLLWFHKTHQYQPTILGATPSGIYHFMLFKQKSDAILDWDLRSVKLMLIAAEYISYRTCCEFIHEMEKYHLKRNVFVPFYGLSEATLVATSSRPDEEIKVYNLNRNHLNMGQKVVFCSGLADEEGIHYVDVGGAIKNIGLKVRDASGKELEEGEIGLVCIKGASITNGYYRNAKATSGVFDQDGWMNTGDLGFMMNNRLVVVGRAKEIIIVNGVNYTPYDIEAVISQNINESGYQFIACNGFNNSTHKEQLLIFVNYQNKLEDFMGLFKKVKAVVIEKMGLMVDEVIPIPEIPRTISGKIRRVELSQRFNNGDFNAVLKQIRDLLNRPEVPAPVGRSAEFSRNHILNLIIRQLEAVLEIKVTDFNQTFVDMGLVSANAPELLAEIEALFHLNLSVSFVYDYPTVNRLVDHIDFSLKRNEESTPTDPEVKGFKNPETEENMIAIVGMSCRFPGGANDPERFWNLLVNGISGTGEMPNERWDVEKYYDRDKNAPGKMYTHKGGFLDVALDQFDAQFFNISPKEAMALDPQQRILLELTWEAFEDAGLDITQYSGTNTGVYVGISIEEYSLAHRNSGDFNKIDAYSLTGTTFSTACGRISYTFGFEGPSMAIDTACSSGLTAFHVACKALGNGEADAAIVAGVNLILTPNVHVAFSKLQAISADGCSKTFDASANGYGRGEGAGVVVLKPLKTALKEHNHILAVVRGTSVNQDGKSNGLTAPNGLAQQKVIWSALKDANLEPGDIDYIEMHGTGTPLGDPIEVKALNETYCRDRNKENPLWIGSVKSNIGHLEAAAGLASIIKVILAFKNHTLPGNLHFETPNPYIPWDTIPVEVVSKTIPWNGNGKARRVGINAFGFGGSNAHVILEEAPGEINFPERRGLPVNILKISAKTKDSLAGLTRKYVDFMKKFPDTDLKELCYQANVSRVDFEQRLAVVGADKEEMLRRLEAYDRHPSSIGVYSSADHPVDSDPKLVFMFSGQGTQYRGMGRELYHHQPIFKQSLDECDRLFRPYILKSILELIYGEDASEAQIDQTSYAQPLIFSIEYSLYQMWRSWGVTPLIVLGHSIGEYAAAVAAAVMNLEDAVKLVAARGRLMHIAPGAGAMGTIFSDEKTVLALIEMYRDQVAVAAVNAEKSIVISGETLKIDNILKQADQAGYKSQRLKVSHGFHSPLMSPILDDFKMVASGVTYRKPQIKFLSTLRAGFLDEAIPDAEYWTRHIQEKVKFYDCLMILKEMGNFIFLEIGAHTPLCSLGKMSLDDHHVFIPSLNKKQSDLEQVFAAVGQLYSCGVNLCWNQLEPGRADGEHPKLNLPTYAFDRKPFWMRPIFEHQANQAALTPGQYHPFIGQKITTARLENSVIFQSTFTYEKPFFMSEHIIFNTPISPAAAHTSMLLSASRHLYGSESCMLRNVEFQNPLIVNRDEERLVQIYFENIASADTKFELLSRDNKVEHADWVTHSMGNYRRVAKDKASDSAVSINELENRFPEDLENDFYESLTHYGFNLGPGFRCIKKIWKEGNEGVCLLEPLEGIPDQDIYEVYPGIIDSIFQTGIAIPFTEVKQSLDGKGSVDSIKTVIPISISKLTYHYRPARQFWCHAQVALRKEILEYDIHVYNELGELLFEIENLILKITDRRSLLRDLYRNNDHLLYNMRWVAEKIINNRYAFDASENYIIFEDNRGMISNISKFLLHHAVNPIVVKNGDTYQRLSDNQYFVSSHRKNDFHQLMADVVSQNGTGNYKLIYAWGMDAADPGGIPVEQLLANQRTSCEGLLNLTQSLAEQKLTESFKVWVVTENVHPVQEPTPVVSIAQSTLWGFAKVVELEYPLLWGGIIDIGFGVMPDDYEGILREIQNASQKQVCLRSDGKRYVQRLMRYQPANPGPGAPPPKIKSDATYLITGGTGALGLICTEYLIRKGAKHLVVVGRREPDHSILSRIEQWNHQGINLKLIQADLSRAADVQNLVQTVTESMPAIKGVIHGAGSLEDRMINEQTWDSFLKVFEPKVLGTWLLHDALRDCALDFFIMFSSITSVFGNIGQSNYAAANYFLNVFSSYRRQNNLPALSICWGPWAEAGMAAANSQVIRQLSQRGLFGIPPDAGLKILDQLMDDQNSSQVLVADVDWQLFADQMGGGDIQNVLSDVMKFKDVPKEKEQVPAPDILDKLKAVQPEERKAELLTYLQSLVANIMGFSDHRQLWVDKALMEQGADSLMIFSIRNELSKIAGKTLNPAIFFNYPSLVKIADYLLSEALVFEDTSNPTRRPTLKTDDILSEIQSLIK